MHSDSRENRNIVIELDGAEELSCTERIVVFLAHDLLGYGYHLFIDNYYMSARLAEFLLKHDTLVTGTCRPNRGIPLMLKNIDVPTKTSRFARKQNLLAVKMVDQKS